ncbi:MAG: DNA polymerase III subunit gamma/tau [Planctomycetia bacterium]
MRHEVLSRKYRPQGFDEMVGQEHVARILSNAMASGRVGHAYLFVGPRGCGKTTTARIFAKAINCATPLAKRSEGRPCGTCPSCRDITAGSDLDVVEMDAASNNAVDDVRELRAQVGYQPVRSPFRIWIVDEVHMLSTPAFNAFLKTLEEPPAHVKFLFCTTEAHRLPATFRSRCQLVEFRPIAGAAMLVRLQRLLEREGASAEEGVLEAIARHALGGLRDAESLLEQLLAMAPQQRITRADYDAIAGRAPDERLAALQAAVEAGDAAAALDAVQACLQGATRPGVLLDQWLESLRLALSGAARAGDTPRLVRTSRAVDVLLAKRQHLRAGADGGLVLEAAAVELARLPQARDLDRLVEALRARSAAPPGPAAQAALPAGTPGRAAAGGRPAASVPGPAAALPAAPSGSSSGPASGAAPGAPPAAAGAQAAALTLALVEQRWAALQEAASRRDVRLREALRRVRPTALQGTRLLLAAPRGDVMARSTLERPEMQQALRQATRDVLGSELSTVVEVDSSAGNRSASELREPPQVRRLAELVGGRVLQVEREAPAPAAAPAARAAGAGPQDAAPEDAAAEAGAPAGSPLGAPPLQSDAPEA